MAKIIYKNIEGASINICFQPPFLLKGKEGFETVENEVTTTTLHGVDGEHLITKRLVSRAMIVDGLLVAESENERYSLRRELIKTINPKMSGTLTFFINDDQQYEIDVIPTKAPSFKEVINDGSVNSSVEDFSLALLALDPYWRDVSYYNSLIPMTVKENKLSFPLKLSRLYRFGSMKNGEIVSIDNSGDNAVGGEFKIEVHGDCIDPRIYNILTEEYFGFQGTYLAGDILFFSTKHGEKTVTLTRDGKTSNAMKNRLPGSCFLQIATGENHLQSQAKKGNDYLYVSLKFIPLVMGV